MRRPTIFLAATVAGALATAATFRPLRRPSAAALASFSVGWPTAELPLHVIAVQATAAVVAARAGAVRGRQGVAGVVLTAASWSGLVALRARAGGAARLLEQSLVDTLGEDFHDRVVHPRAAGASAEEAAKLPGALRVARIRSRYAHDADISYGPHGRANHLDIWRREDVVAGAKAPVLVQLPGGAWVVGNKQGQGYPLMATMVELGWVCVPISYRLAPKATWPAHIVDVKAAIAWVKAHIADYGGDPDFVAITGGSAGGHLASLAALTADDPGLQPGFEQADTSVRAAVPLYGVYDWTPDASTGGDKFTPFVQRLVVKEKWDRDRARFTAASPIRRVHPDAPPFFVIAAANDTMVGASQPRSFVAALRASSRQPVAAVELPDAQHAFDMFGSPRTVAAAQAVADFLGFVYGDHLRASA